MRRAVAAKVAESFATVPHFYLRSEVDVTSLVQLRQQNLEAFEKSCGQRPSLTDFLLRAMALALRDCPQANRIWQNDTIVHLPSIDVGLVVQVGDGLLVPIIHHADRLGLVDLVRQRAKLMAAVRSGKTPADIFQGGATSLTQPGQASRRRVRADHLAAAEQHVGRGPGGRAAGGLRGPALPAPYHAPDALGRPSRDGRRAGRRVSRPHRGIVGEALPCCFAKRLPPNAVARSHMETCQRMKGKRVLVTGSGTGIGKGVALEFCREGADVVSSLRP